MLCYESGSFWALYSILNFRYDITAGENLCPKITLVALEAARFSFSSYHHGKKSALKAVFDFASSSQMLCEQAIDKIENLWI